MFRNDISFTNKRIQMKPLLRQAQCDHSTIVLSAILNAIVGNGLNDTCRFRNCGRPTDSGLESFFRTFWFHENNKVVSLGRTEIMNGDILDKLIGLPVYWPVANPPANHQCYKVAVVKAIIPTSFWIGQRMRHRDFKSSLGSGFDPMTTSYAENIRHPDPLNLDILPNFEAH